MILKNPPNTKTGLCPQTLPRLLKARGIGTHNFLVWGMSNIYLFHSPPQHSSCWQKKVTTTNPFLLLCSGLTRGFWKSLVFLNLGTVDLGIVGKRIRLKSIIFLQKKKAVKYWIPSPSLNSHKVTLLQGKLTKPQAFNSYTVYRLTGQLAALVT